MQTDPAKRNNVTLNGQAGNDTLAVDDSVFDDEDVPYTLSAAAGILPDRVVRNTGPLTITTYGYTSMQSMILGGTRGANTFNVDAFNPNGPLAVHGGAGNDVLNVSGAVVRLFPSNSLSFLGGDDYDTFNMLDGAMGSTAYTVFATAFRRNSTDVPLTTTERINITGSALNDDLFITSQDPGQLVNFDGGDGNDRFLTSGTSADGVRGPVVFNGEGGADNRVVINDQSDTTGDTFHVDQTTVNAVAGDNLFGEGGSLAFSGVQQIDVNCGSGLDVAFVQPNATARVNVHHGAQTGSRGAGAGDTLNLALADAVNYVITPGAAGSGTVTSDNFQPLTYTGVEEGPFVDDVAPSVAASSFEVDAPQHALLVAFSEDVSATLSSGSFVLTNLTTGEPVAPADIAYAYDTVTNTATFTFPNFASGALPDGDYRLVLAAGAVSDLFGNPLQVEHALDFFFLQGDANRDRRVDLTDFNRLAANFGTTGGAVFGQADFNYDGNVNLQDFNILAGRFGTSLDGAGTVTRRV